MLCFYMLSNVMSRDIIKYYQILSNIILAKLPLLIDRLGVLFLGRGKKT